MTTLHDVRGVLGRPLDTSFWALTISWSRLMCEVALSQWFNPTGLGLVYFSKFLFVWDDVC
jgi:hypothetical protein